MGTGTRRCFRGESEAGENVTVIYVEMEKRITRLCTKDVVLVVTRAFVVLLVD